MVAEDKGRPMYRTSAEVCIEIEDENDCIPKFEFPNYHFSIDEDAEPYRRGAREVGIVQASDCDSGLNAEIHYLLEETDTPFKVCILSLLYISKLKLAEFRAESNLIT